MKSQIQKKKKKKKNAGIVELLIPTFFQKKLLMRAQKLSWEKNYVEVVLNWRTNDQIMPRCGRSFIAK